MQTLLKESNLVTCHHANSWKVNYLQNAGDCHLIGVQNYTLKHLLWPQPNFLHIQQKDLVNLFAKSQPLVDHVEVVNPFHRLWQGKKQLVKTACFELLLRFMHEVGKMNGLDGLIRVNDSQSHSHFAVVEIHYQGRSSIMHFLFWTKPMSILHILIINFYCLLPLIQTQYSSKILRVVYPLYPVIMQ